MGPMHHLSKPGLAPFPSSPGYSILVVAEANNEESAKESPLSSFLPRTEHCDAQLFHLAEMLRA